LFLLLGFILCLFRAAALFFCVTTFWSHDWAINYLVNHRLLDQGESGRSVWIWIYQRWSVFSELTYSARWMNASSDVTWILSYLFASINGLLWVDSTWSGTLVSDHGATKLVTIADLL
jgi:hypothetical protein